MEAVAAFLLLHRHLMPKIERIRSSNDLALAQPLWGEILCQLNITLLLT